VSTEDFTGPPTGGPVRLPTPRAAGWYAGPADAPDRYELLGDGIGGGEGTTWRARYRGALRSPVPLGIKLLNSPQGLERWNDQLVLLQNVHMDHVVALHDVFAGPPPHGPGLADRDAGEVIYVSMEWVEGPTVAELCAAKPATAATIAHRLQYVADAAEALHEMHGATRDAGNPAVHRDMKPGNCIVNPGRGVVLIDLSGMRAVDESDPDGLHTAAYTAPEVLRRPYARREASSDLYALGAFAAFCMTGEDPPPAGAAAADRLATRLYQVARAAGVTEVDAFVTTLLAMLRADPASRPAKSQAWAAELQKLAGRRKPVRKPRRRPAVIAVGALAVLAAGSAALGLPGARPWRSAPETAAAASLPAVTTGAAVAPPVPSKPIPPSASVTPRVFATTQATGTTGNSVPAKPTAARRTTAPPPVVVTASGSISSPASGAGVLNCAYFSGTAKLPAGRTLILAMRNLDNGDSTQYVEEVFGWDTPSRLTSWRGAQYFATVGQRYRVELMSVDLAAVQAAGHDSDANNALAADGVELASREVARKDGDTGDVCPGP
jgi:serine/threonine protein kinase